MDKKKLKSKVFELLSTFSKQEMKKFGEFLNSPYHNKSKKLVKIYAYIRKFHPGFCDDKLTLESIHLNVYPKKKIHPPTVRNNLSDLYELALQYLSVTIFVSKKRYSYEYVFRQLNSRRLYKQSEFFSKQIEPEINGINGWDIELLEERYWIKINQINRNLRLMDYTGESKNNLSQLLKLYDEAFHNLFVFFIAQVSELYSNVKLIEVDQNKSIDMLQMQTFLSNSNFRKLRSNFCNVTENPILTLIIDYYTLLSNINTKRFYFIYKKNYYKYFDSITNAEQSFHLDNLIAYCLRRRDITKDKLFTDELLEWYELLLTKELYNYQSGNYIYPLVFRSMIVNSVENGFVNWTINLISTYLNKLHYKDRKTMKLLGEMYIAFHRNHFDMALNLANDMYNSNTFRGFRFDIFNILIRSLYETKEFEPCLDLIKSHTTTVRNSELIPELQRVKRLKFLQILSRMIFLQNKSKYSKSDINELIAQSENSSFSNWLSIKLHELRKKKVEKEL